MVRVGGRGGKKKTKESNRDELLPSLLEIKKDKHRSCESKRRQLETNAVENLKGIIVGSKKYRYGDPVKLDKLQLLSGATLYIQENLSALNILVGVLCNTIANSPSFQDSISELSLDNEYVPINLLFEKLSVSSIDDLVEQVDHSNEPE